MHLTWLPVGSGFMVLAPGVQLAGHTSAVHHAKHVRQHMSICRTQSMPTTPRNTLIANRPAIFKRAAVLHASHPNQSPSKHAAPTAVLISELEGPDQAQGLVHGAAHGQIVDGDLAQDAGGGDDEQAAAQVDVEDVW